MIARFASAAALDGTLLDLAGAGPASASFVPGGSYAAICRSIRTNGPILSAAASTAAGMWSSIVVPRCGGTGVSNRNGRLACGGHHR